MSTTRIWRRKRKCGEVRDGMQTPDLTGKAFFECVSRSESFSYSLSLGSLCTPEYRGRRFANSLPWSWANRLLPRKSHNLVALLTLWKLRNEKMPSFLRIFLEEGDACEKVPSSHTGLRP